ncbi:MAG TPA: hypothetical protein VK638_36710 [Edaphobacter sp.]|nr:hypothetical protein [Edaphobacter sp.]
MATAPMPDPGGATQVDPASAPPQGAPQPSQAPASPEQMMLAKIFQASQQLMQNPIISSGMQKVMAGIQEAQSALVTQAPPPTPGQTPPY